MDRKIIKMLIHVLKEEHILKNYSYRLKKDNIYDLHRYFNEGTYYNVSENPNRTISHLINWSSDYNFQYCLSLYKFVYFLKRIMNIEIEDCEYVNLIERSYISSKHKKIDNYVTFLLTEYKK